MDYSLLIGIHDFHQAAEDAEARGDGNRSDDRHDSDSEDYDSGERWETGEELRLFWSFILLILKNLQIYLKTERKNGTFRWENTPPDSPRGQLEAHAINPEIDVYALPSQEG